jgi:hypothetical protein
MKEGFNGNLKEIILHMIENDTDCCEVTNTVGDTSVTVEVTITKIVSGDEVIYDAVETDADVELVSFDEDDIGYLS